MNWIEFLNAQPIGDLRIIHFLLIAVVALTFRLAWKKQKKEARTDVTRRAPR